MHFKKTWEEEYDKYEIPPWSSNEFDLDYKEYFKDKRDLTVIDLGCGNGSQVYYLEKWGFDVTGTDIVNALEYDIKKFIIDDALDSKLNNKYDVVLDKGLIHNLIHEDDRDNYFEMVENITHDKSVILLKVLSENEMRFNPQVSFPNPYRFTKDQLLNLYSSLGFECVSFEDTYFYSHLKPYLKGYFTIYKRSME